jgi:hypothetical protein
VRAVRYPFVQSLLVGRGRESFPHSPTAFGSGGGTSTGDRTREDSPTHDFPGENEPRSCYEKGGEKGGEGRRKGERRDGLRGR